MYLYPFQFGFCSAASQRKSDLVYKQRKLLVFVECLDDARARVPVLLLAFTLQLQMVVAV